MSDLAKDFDWPTADLVYTIRDGKLVIGKYDYAEHKLTSLKTAEISSTDRLQIHYIKRSNSPLTADLTDTPEHPSQFHEAFVLKY